MLRSSTKAATKSNKTEGEENGAAEKGTKAVRPMGKRTGSKAVRLTGKKAKTYREKSSGERY